MSSLCEVLVPYLDGKGKVISISGPSASGKTTLALQIAASILEGEKTIWIQASERFSRKRVDSLFGNDGSQKAKVMKNTYLLPPTHTVLSFDELSDLLSNLCDQDLPPGIRFIVIDNISHHLRHALYQYNDINQRSRIVNVFFDDVMFPLIMRCFREQIHLVLIHEVSQDVETGRTRSFYYKLFNRIESLEIKFSGMTRLGTQSVIVESGVKRIFSGRYDIASSGIMLGDQYQSCPL